MSHFEFAQLSTARSFTFYHEESPIWPIKKITHTQLQRILTADVCQPSTPPRDFSIQQTSNRFHLKRVWEKLSAQLSTFKAPSWHFVCKLSAFQRLNKQYQTLPSASVHGPQEWFVSFKKMLCWILLWNSILSYFESPYLWQCGM